MPNTTLNTEILHRRLSDLPIAAIRYYDVTGSTNDDALTWLEHGAPDGSLVLAEEQTAGRGRMRRTWVTRKNTSLAFTLIFRPEKSNLIPFHSPLGALGVARALEDLADARPQIKWPNDVLLDGKKVCGILTEACWQGDRLAGVVVGIGINVASTALGEEDRFIFPAGTLEKCLGRPIDRLDLLTEVLRMIFDWRPRLGSNEFLDAWNQRLAFRGEQVRINRPGQKTLIGAILYIDQDGCLRVRQENGEENSISAGDVG